MYLGLVDRPFVPHNLISAQESPVPLPEFQMAPRLKLLMSSGSKKGTQIYYPFSLKKSQQVNPLQVPPWGPYGERYLLTGHFDISLYRNGPKKRASLHGPQKRGPYGNGRPFPEHYLTYLSGSPVKEPSLQVPHMQSPRREMPSS